MFKKIIAYVGICLCCVLCFGMFFIKPVKAQVVSQGTDVNLQWFPSSINMPVSASGFDLDIAVPIEVPKSSLETPVSQLGNTIHFTSENNDLFSGEISYITQLSEVASNVNILVSQYYLPIAIRPGASVYSNELVIHFDQMILPQYSGSYTLDLPFIRQQREEFALSLVLRAISYDNTTSQTVNLPYEDFVLDNCSFYRVGRDTNGNVARELVTVDLSRIPFDDEINAFFSNSLFVDNVPMNVYYLGNILNYSYGWGNSDLSFGDNFVLVEDFELRIHLYANTYQNFTLDTEVYPNVFLSTPLIPTDNADLSYTMEEYLDISNGFTFEMDIPEPVDMSLWLITSVGAFMNAELFPGFALGGLLAVIIAFPIVVWFLKILAGG